LLLISLVNKDVVSNVVVAGSPANIKKTDYSIWYVRDERDDRVKAVKQLKIQMRIDVKATT
jgi:serine acetyltransferase